MCKKIWSCLLFLTLFSVPALAQEERPLSLEQTLRYVYEENPSILAARYNLKATEELYPQAMAGWKPRASAETGIFTTDVKTGNFSQGDGATTKSASVSIEQPLFRGFRTQAEMEAAEHQIAAETERVRATEQDVFLQSVESYMNVIRDRLILGLQQKNRLLLGKERESVVARFDAGDLTQTDVKQMEARYSRAIADEAIAESQLQTSEATFERITGVWPSNIFVMPVPPFVFPQTLDDLVKAAAMQNPDLIASRRAHEAAEEDITSAKSDFYPQISAYASHVKELDPQPGIVDESETSTIGLRARISLYEGGSTLSRIREAKSRASQRFVETLAAEKSVKSDLVSSWRRLKASEAEIAARELEVAAAQFSSEGVREEARLGDRTVFDTLEAEQDVLDAESALVQARRDRIVTAYRLAAALGILNPKTLNLQSAPAVGPEYARLAD
ncbi:MAG: type I secretion protein TolC [Micavibrio aeruginosavorus]|uniref:Type I secretion protein TolC n=1 Tax=Micavibrio aeruginosavorus TaxID=349221 RepID=A0A2W5N7D7_9BACT|nr:MAG: type I secretion protein TolC [Micavibrio aeruginosavorus]